MATSAFKSTTKRTSIGSSPNSTTDDSSSSANRSSSVQRRSRSLSRFSRRLPVEDKFPEETPRGRFVNKVRGTGFPEISLDDLAIEFFDSSVDRGRSASRSRGVSHNNGSGGGGGGSGGSARRGRSVSRQGTKVSGGDASGGGRAEPATNSNSRRRRSMSVARYQISDSESDLDHSQKSGNRASLKSNINPTGQMSSSHRPTASNHRPALRRSVSQKDLRHTDGYSSHSSAITDDEGLDAQTGSNEIERMIRSVYAQKAENPTGESMNDGLYDAMRRELRHAVEEIKMELEQKMVISKTSTGRGSNSLKSKTSDPLQAVSTIRRSYATKIEQSEKRKQNLLAEMVLEEQRGRELSKIVKELLPDPTDSIVEKPSRARKRSNDRHKMSSRLTEEAEKYIEEFISNIEDTDISSLDGERSETSSTLGGIIKTETYQTPLISKPLSVGTDGVVLPWLQWETTNDPSTQTFKDNMAQPKATPKRDVFQEPTTGPDLSYRSTSSRGSWSPPSINCAEDKGCKYEEVGSVQSRSTPSGTTRSTVDMDKYLELPRNEEFLLERWTQQRMINSGSLLLCNHMFF